ASDRALPERSVGIYAVRLPAGEAGRGEAGARGRGTAGGGAHLPVVSDAGRDAVPHPRGAGSRPVRRAGQVRPGGSAGGCGAAAGVGTGRGAARSLADAVLVGGSGAAGAGGGARSAVAVAGGGLEGSYGG